MISSQARPPGLRSRFACIAVLVVLVLAACGSEDQSREFAPEIRSEQVVESSTPRSTSTPEPLNRQPGESAGGIGNAADLIEQQGSAQVVGYGLSELYVLAIESGETRSTNLPRDASSVSAVAPDGSMILTIDRSEGPARLVARDVSDVEVARWQAPADATPGATPVSVETIRSGDRIVWNQQSSHAIVGIEDVGVVLAVRVLNLTPFAPAEPTSLTAMAWAPAGQSVALASWDSSRQAARILTASLQDLSRLTLVVELAEGDGRFVRSLAWGNERVGLVFALRSLNAGSSFPSDLYYLPRFGQPMRLLATAGAAAPAAVVDQIAIAGNGATVAYTVLIPGEVGFRFHSLWITDAESPDPIRVETPGIRRVTDLAWTGRGLALIGTRRETTGDAQTQASVVELVTTGGLTTIGAIRSEATPAGSPQTSPNASPAAGTPESG